MQNLNSLGRIIYAFFVASFLFFGLNVLSFGTFFQVVFDLESLVTITVWTITLIACVASLFVLTRLRKI
jgi:hypothetical protein